MVSTSQSSSPSITPPQAATARESADYAPANPSRLRESHNLSSENMSMSNAGETEPTEEPRSLAARVLDIFRGGPQQQGTAESSWSSGREDVSNLVHNEHDECTPLQPDARSRLLDSYNRDFACGTTKCGHGTFSPKAASSSDISSASSTQGIEGGRDSDDGPSASQNNGPGENPGRDGDRGMSASKILAKKHGVKNTRRMYITYYIPSFTWIRQYRWAFLGGDLMGALTVASVYVPMALSLASNLAHGPAINGLYSFVFSPFVYALLGSSPRMIVGSEAAGSLLVGTVIRKSGEQTGTPDDDDVANAHIMGLVTGMAGAFTFIGGLTRLGFLDNVLSRPFLRGFVSAIGATIFVDQLIPEMGLSGRASDVGGVTHGSSVDKLVFLFRNGKDAHILTCAISFGSFAIIMLFRTLKKRVEHRFPSINFFPDRFLVVVFAAVLTWKFNWDAQGLEIMGPLKETGSGLFAFRWPIRASQMKHIRAAMATSFIISLLGFFESSVAAKALGEVQGPGIQGMTLSANRELIALGVGNMVSGCFMGLPGFGGYGKSKLNAATGAKTPMSSIFLSLITLFCLMFMMRYLFYLPRAVLSSMISVVAFTLIEECPHDIRFFVRLRSWSDLSLMLLIFLATMFYSLELGIALGIGLSILSVIRHSTKPRIQILGKVPGTDRFENAELHPEKVEFIDGCLIVKIPEPLTFANTGDLKNRLRRLEFYGSNAAHPSLPRLRLPEHNKNIIFDVHGVISIDGSGTQVFSEIVQAYADRGVNVYFCRLPPMNDVFRKFQKSGIVDTCGGMGHFVSSVEEALRLTEVGTLRRENYE